MVEFVVRSKRMNDAEVKKKKQTVIPMAAVLPYMLEGDRRVL